MSDAENKIDEIAAALRDIAVHLRQQPANKAILYHLLSRIVRNNPDVFIQIHSDITACGTPMDRVSDDVIHAAVASQAKSKATGQPVSEPGHPGPSPVQPGGPGFHDPSMALHVTTLEAGLRDVKAALNEVKVLSARVDERTGFLATGSGLSVLKGDVMLALGGKAGRGTIWAAALSAAGLVIAAAAVGAVYLPYLAALLHRPG
jgi:hypothetical protein